MHPTIGYELAQAKMTEPRHQARRGAWARATRRAHRAPARRSADDGVQCQALFASDLQPWDAPGADVVAEAISATMQQFGTYGCTGRMAQEFGDRPETATERMRWVRSLLSFR
jgi:hypothetical protein